MADQNEIKRAEKAYAAIIKMLDDIDFRYSRYDEDMTIKCGIKGDDLPIDILMRVKTEQQVVQVRSILPFNMSEDKRVDGAIAVCVANYNMINGAFDYDISDGEISFRMCAPFHENELGHEQLEYMLMCTASTVDAYNDKFFMISKGMLPLEQFIESERE